MAQVLNRECHCISVDPETLQRLLETGANTAGLYASMIANQPHLFAAVPVFLEPEHTRKIQEIIRAAETVIALPGFQQEAMASAPAIARHDWGPRGVFDSFDFHLGKDGPRLIEINTNAGGALLNLALAQAQRACCPEMNHLALGPVPVADLDRVFMEMFLTEWRLQRSNATLRAIAIIDDDPERQYLFPEFLLFREMFQRAGLTALITPAAELDLRDGGLWHGPTRIDFVYNRLTDFYLDDLSHVALREAYEQGRVVVSPNPHGHALRASKRHLTVFSDRAALERLGAEASVIDTLLTGIPRTELLGPASAERFWAERKGYFFKPLSGYGGKAAYRGDKLTKKTWEAIHEQPYVAQRIVTPSERMIKLDGKEVPLKLDLRAYVYAGQMLMIASRLYAGQTTNFRTPGGGFAPVFTAPSAYSEGIGEPVAS